MADAFLGEIRLLSFSYAPVGWALCDGSILPIAQHEALFSILGNRYGGDGSTTFGLPDLRGRVPIHTKDNSHIGEKLGEENHQLTLPEIPVHTHTSRCSTEAADNKTAAGNIWAASTQMPYSTTSNKLDSVQALATMGASAVHNNMQPYTVINYCIALTGIFPPRD